jgi:hypothetical protein
VVLLAHAAHIPVSKEESACLAIVQNLEGVDGLFILAIFVFEKVLEF